MMVSVSVLIDGVEHGPGLPGYALETETVTAVDGGPVGYRARLSAPCEGSPGFVEFGGFVFRVHPGDQDTAKWMVRVPGPWFPTTYLPPHSTPLSGFVDKSMRFHSAPDSGFGLITLYMEDGSGAMGAWMDTGGESAYIPGIRGDGHGVSLEFVEDKSQYLSSGDSVLSGTLFIAGGQGPADVFRQYADTVHGFFETDAATPQWLAGTVMLEAYPAYYEGGLKGLTHRIPFYRDIGFNTLYLMPHWKGGYMPVDPYAMDENAGTEEDLRDLVDTAHTCGMRVLFDMVVHGFSPQSPLVAKKPDMFCRDRKGAIAEHPTWKSLTTDWASPEYSVYMSDLARHHRERYGNDGYRVDAATFKGPNWDPTKVGTGYKAYSGGSESPSIIRGMLDAMRGTNPDAAMLSEVFGPLFYSVCGLVHDNQTEAVQQLLDLMDEGKATAADYKTHMEDTFALLPPEAHRVFFSRNHDTSWFYHFGGYTPRFMAMEAIHALCAVPEVFGGDPHHGPNPDDEGHVWPMYKALFALKADRREFVDGRLVLRGVESSNPMVFTAARVSGDSASIVAVSLGNGVEAVTVTLAGDTGIRVPEGSNCIDAFSGAAVPLTVSGDGKMVYLELKPCQAAVIGCRVG